MTIYHIGARICITNLCNDPCGKTHFEMEIYAYNIYVVVYRLCVIKVYTHFYFLHKTLYFYFGVYLIF